MTRVFSFPTPEDASQRNSEVKVPELDSRNLTDERFAGRRLELSKTFLFEPELLDIIDKIDLFMFLLTGLSNPIA